MEARLRGWCEVASGVEWQAAAAASSKCGWWRTQVARGARGRSMSSGGTGCAWRWLRAGIERRHVEVRDAVVAARAGGVQASAGARRRRRREGNSIGRKREIVRTGKRYMTGGPRDFP